MASISRLLAESESRRWSSLASGRYCSPGSSRPPGAGPAVAYRLRLSRGPHAGALLGPPPGGLHGGLRAPTPLLPALLVAATPLCDGGPLGACPRGDSPVPRPPAPVDAVGPHSDGELGRRLATPRGAGHQSLAGRAGRLPGSAPGDPGDPHRRPGAGPQERVIHQWGYLFAFSD